ncbi:hypothetical protein ACFWF3_20120 [Nocardia sp. NPDC060220]|uniref:hypothetical protein n=1 Tax=Nocardia sp. NPDC060220 TaxID=3347076 RepID=UPI00364A204C
MTTSGGPGGPWGYPQQPGPFGAPPQQPYPQQPYGQPSFPPQQPQYQQPPAQYGAPQSNYAVPQQAPPQVGPQESAAVQAYLAAVAHHMTMGGLQVSRNWVGPVLSLIGVGAVIKSSLNPIELAVCVGHAGEISPATVAGFTRQVDEFARSIRRPSAFAVKGGACAVAALISDRVHPASFGAVTNKAMSFGTVVVPAVIDLSNRQMMIAQNTPVMGFAMWSTVRGKAGMYLPDPRAVLG